MSDEQRKCPYCGMAMAPDQRVCPDCGNPYPFDDEAPTLSDPIPPRRAGRVPGPPGADGDALPSGAGDPGPSTGGPLALISQYKTILVLVGVLVLIVAVGYALFRFGMSFFEAGRPDPASISTPSGQVLVPPTLGAAGSPVPGASPSPSPGAGTLIAPGASPSPAAGASPGGGVRLKVANTEGQGANMRQRPSTTAPILRTLPEGASVEAIGDPTNAEGRAWRNIRTQEAQTGWVAADLLAPE